MKRRRFLATIAMILALLIACSSTSVAMESAADYVHEIVTEETDAKQDVFEYPEKADIAGSDENTVTETELRLPDVSNTEEKYLTHMKIFSAKKLNMIILWFLKKRFSRQIIIQLHQVT